MGQFTASIFKLLLACLIAGSALSFLGLDTETLLGFFGLTPQSAWEYLQAFAIWASPRIALGALFIVPAWLLIYLFLPPRAD